MAASDSINYHRKVGIVNFENAIKQALDEYGAEIGDAINETVSEVAEAAVQDLKQSSPRRPGKGHGKYARNWTWQLAAGDNRQSVITQIGARYDSRGKNAVVYGKKPTYRLAHLLEFGHAKQGGGRVSPVPHIADVETRTIEEFWRKLKEKIG